MVAKTTLIWNIPFLVLKKQTGGQNIKKSCTKWNNNRNKETKPYSNGMWRSGISHMPFFYRADGFKLLLAPLKRTMAPMASMARAIKKACIPKIHALIN
jgi:hypothetical protein